ncbi:MAG TPA: hypothetical protein VFJ19_10615 [Nocardioidaceae bacterium]|nr:hypothetical protein [Nocardioidaceae bacterium]
MSFVPMIAVLAAETHGFAAGVNHWVVGGVIFGFLLLVMGCLLAFGAGRDHT